MFSKKPTIEDAIQMVLSDDRIIMTETKLSIIIELIVVDGYNIDDLVARAKHNIKVCNEML